jgi:beta-lactam-binding protein with PASTA domain
MVRPPADVTIWVHRPRRVPQLTGLSQVDACGLVVDMELKCASVLSPTSKRSDIVEKQSPDKGTVLKKGATVTITIPSGIEVPDVVGLSAREACEELRRSGELECDREGFSPDWTVATQSPGAWQLVKEDTRITLKAREPEPACGG